MLKLRLSKLKQLCASVLLPRLLLKNLKYPRELTYSRALEQLSKARKSTNSGEKNEGNEKQMRIIEKCFSENVPQTESKGPKKNESNYENVITPEYYKVTKCDKCNYIISKIFNDENVAMKDSNVMQPKLQATTSKIEDEKLTQKVEIVDETPHVEAHPPKIEGFNVTPKVLGHESSTFEMSKKNYENTNDNEKQINLDKLAKRCMGAPVDEIDKIITQELKNVSQDNSHIKLDMDLVRNQCVYQCPEMNTTKFDKILPSHLDSVPLLVLDRSVIVTNDYKDCSLIRDYPTIVLTADIDEQPLDIPVPLSPYDKPAIPFYEYINKENITPDDGSKIETAAATETVEEAEIIINEDTLQKDAIPPHPSLEEETLHPKPNINQFTESRTSQSRNCIKGSFLNFFNNERVFTSNPDQPMDWDMAGQPYQAPQQNDDTPNSSISSAYLPGGNRRTLDLPVNTAISANQNPEEYYNMSLPEEFVPENQSTPVQRIFAECPVTQNIFYSALPQIELEENLKRTEGISDITSSHKDPLSHMMIEPEVKQEVCISNKAANEANLEESVEKKDSISCSETLPLSLLLKKIREQNRLEYCRNLIAKTQIELEGTKKFSCPPPLDKSKPKNSVKPCQPKPKPKCKPSPEPCPSACPTKKDPCAKFLPVFLSTIYRYCTTYEDLTPRESPNYNKGNIKLNSVHLITGDIVKRIQEMGERLKFIDIKNVNDKNVIMYARDFEPWIPIPSWPISKKENPKPFVCPKEGCKLPAARTNKSCKEKQCDGMSKKSFASQVFSSSITYNLYNV
ncbi:unnamed protein product [Euphydryas editha]|uniref:Uncharacterized protein n=1 Tax=Euphydryas editha TaxID=104508 RepID=A0AAU9URQ2_EUPED|nr:unnamed protein product [Euphydryas editha]